MRSRGRPSDRGQCQVELQDHPGAISVRGVARTAFHVLRRGCSVASRGDGSIHLCQERRDLQRRRGRST
eukprot:716569-Pyramimonas_sp.AAC.1